MSEAPAAESSATPLQTTEGAMESSSTQGKDETYKRRSVQFQESTAPQEGTNEPAPPDPKNARKRSSLSKRSADSERTTQENKVDAPPTLLETVEEKSEPKKTLDTNPPIPGDISPEVEFTPSVVVVIEPVPQEAEMETKLSSNSIQSSSWVASQPLPSQQEQESEARSPSTPPESESIKDPEIPQSDSEQENNKINQPRPSAGYLDSSNSESDNEDGKVKGKMTKTGSALARNKSRRKSSVFKEIIGSIEKKKGPILPEKLGFGSSEERKALLVEDLKNRKKSQTIIPKEPEDMPKPLERKKSTVQGLGFGSSEKRKTLFDKEDPLKPKEKRKSLLSKEEEKDSLGGKGRRFSLMDPRGSSSKQSAIIAGVPKDPVGEVSEGAQQNMNQASEMRSERAPGAKQLQITDVNQQLSEENQEPRERPRNENESGSNIVGDISRDAHGTVKNFAVIEGVVEGHYPSDEEPVGDDEGQEEPQRRRDRAPSIYGSEAAVSKDYGLQAPSIDSIPVDDNEELASTLLAGKVDEPLRNELENWLSSAINRVDNNLHSSWADPVLRQDSSGDKDSPRRSIPPTKTPRTMVAQPESSSASTKGLSRPLRRLSALSLGILAGTLSDENRLMHAEQHSYSTLPPNLEVQASSVVQTTPRLTPKIETPRQEDEDESHWNQETAEEGLRRLQREVEQRAWAQYFAKRIPRLMLPDSLRKRKKPGESADYLHAESSRDKSARDNILNRDLLCYYGGTEDPEKLKNAWLSGLNIIGVEKTDLEQFQNLQYLDVSVNKVNMQDLWTLPTLRKLSLMSNQMCYLSLTSGQFQNLQALDLSYNILGGSAIVPLANLPALETLNLDHNTIDEIPEASGEPWSFNRLRIFSAAHNFIKSPSFLPLSKIPRLEKLLLAYNGILGVPEEVPSLLRTSLATAAEDPTPRTRGTSYRSNIDLAVGQPTFCRIEAPLGRAFNYLHTVARERLVIQLDFQQIKDTAQTFPRLQILDLTNNKVADSQRLTPLLRCRTLKQVFLWETPMARKLACDGTNRLLDSARPILLHILRAEQAGQSWITKQSRHRTVEFEAKMHTIQQYKAPEIKLFDRMAEQEMAHVFEYTSETISKEAGDTHCAIHKGYASAILPFTDGFQNPVMSISETKARDRARSALSEVATSDIPASMDEAMECIQVSKNLTENHLTDANAAIACLQNTLGVPFREVNFNPKHYLTMTKSGIIRVNEHRLGNQEPISPRKDAVYLAQRFLYQAEVRRWKTSLSREVFLILPSA